MRRALTRAATALLVAALFVAPEPARAAAPCPRIVSHATSKLLAPENTLPGIAATAATGATGVEMDVQWSVSNFPILMHDATVDRTTPGTGAPSSLGLGQLRALRANDFAPAPGAPRWDSLPDFTGANTPYVPYGYEFMDAATAAGLDVVIDIHATPTQVGMDKLHTYVAAYFGWAQRTVVMASAAHVTTMRGWEPGLRYAVIEYPPAGRIYTGEHLTGLGAVAYVVPWDRISPAMVAYYHAYGLQVFAWTSDSAAVDVAANWQRVADAGTDALITNEPAAALAALGCAGEN